MSKKSSWETEFVVYHIKSAHFHKGFNTESGAKRSTSCANRNTAGVTAYAYTTSDNYWSNINGPVKMVERTNLMTGKKFMEAEDTPYFCSPASETYWSM